MILLKTYHDKIIVYTVKVLIFYHGPFKRIH